jgi:hypothetical protein
MGIYYLFGKEFGFTPAQVDEIDIVTIQSLSTIHEARCKAEMEAIKHGGRR